MKIKKIFFNFLFSLFYKFKIYIYICKYFVYIYILYYFFINVNHPNIKTSFSKEGINTLAAAIYSAGGATVGFKVAQYIGRPPVVKIVAGLGTMAVVQGTTAIMSRVLNSNSGNNGKLKFIY